jgi:hypothetical protein
MTEAEWLACTDPTPMLEYVRGKASDRKFRLLGCACVRSVWSHLTDLRSREAVELAEVFADGKVTEEQVKMGITAAYQAAYGQRTWTDWCAVSTLGKFPLEAVRCGHYETRCILLRCIFGNPFRPVTIDPTVLTWNGGTIPRMAQAIYDDRRFADLPILADALEEAGCSEPAILSHCRSGGEHVRGCWVVDLLLGKE